MMMPSGGGGGVGGGPAEEAACSSGAAPSRAEAKRPQQTLSVLPRPSLGPPSKNSATKNDLQAQFCQTQN